MVQEFIYSVSQRDTDRTLKISSIEGFAYKLGKNITLRLMEDRKDNKMKL